MMTDPEDEEVWRRVHYGLVSVAMSLAGHDMSLHRLVAKNVLPVSYSVAVVRRAKPRNLALGRTIQGPFVEGASGILGLDPSVCNLVLGRKNLLNIA